MLIQESLNREDATKAGGLATFSATLLVVSIDWDALYNGATEERFIAYVLGALTLWVGLAKN